MTVERHVALQYPFFHQKQATNSRVIVVLLISQLPFILFYFLPEDSAKKYILALTGAIFLLMCGINLKLFCLTRTMRRRVHIPLESLNGPGERSTRSNKSKVTLANLGKVSTCLLAVACLFICYCPFLGVIGFELTKSANEIENSAMYYLNLNLWAETFFTLNSTFNCLIFFYKNSVLRRHGGNVLRKCVSCATARLRC
jgi:hypothetical protein